MGMGTPVESSPREAYLNDLAARTTIGEVYVMARQTQLQLQTAVLTLAFGGQNGQNSRP